MENNEKFMLVKEKLLIENQIEKGELITLYYSDSSKDDYNRTAFFSALVQPPKTSDIMKNYSWDILIGHGKPGFTSYCKEGKEIIEYKRYSDEFIERKNLV